MDQIHNEVAQELYAQYHIGRGRHGFTPFQNISTEDQNGWRAVAAHVMANTGLTVADSGKPKKAMKQKKTSSKPVETAPVSETVTAADLEPNTEEATGAVIIQDESGD